MKNTVRAEVVKKGNESASSLIRRFSRKVQSAGILRTMRARRFFTRQLSRNNQRRHRVASLKKTEKFLQEVKLGNIDPTARKKRRF